jgi:hypothetical protein
VSRAVAYGTPVVCLEEGALSETDGGALVVAGGTDEIADATARLVTDREALTRLRREVETLRSANAPHLVAENFVAVWSK